MISWAVRLEESAKGMIQIWIGGLKVQSMNQNYYRKDNEWMCDLHSNRDMVICQEK